MKNKTNNKNRKLSNNYVTTLLCNFVTFMAAIFILNVPAYAFEDIIITNNSKLTDIKIENNEIIDVFPLTTIMNDKNTLIVHPLKEGISRFIVLKGEKDLEVFSVKVETDNTIIEPVKGFDIFSIDLPPGISEFELDEPPILK